MGSILEESKRLRDQYAILRDNAQRRKLDQMLQSKERRRLAENKRKADFEEAIIRAAGAKKAKLNGLVNRGKESLDLLSKVSLQQQERYQKKKLNADVMTEKAKRNKLATEQWSQNVNKMLNQASARFNAKISVIKQAVDKKLLDASKRVDLAQKIELLVDREYNLLWSRLERARETRELDILRKERQAEKTGEIERRGNEPSRKRKREEILGAFGDESVEIGNAVRANAIDKIIGAGMIRKDRKMQSVLQRGTKRLKADLIRHRAHMIKHGKVSKPAIGRIFKSQKLLGGRPQPMEAATYVASTASQRALPLELTLKRGVAVS